MDYTEEELNRAVSGGYSTRNDGWGSNYVRHDLGFSIMETENDEIIRE